MKMPHEPTVFVVDDDDAVRDALSWLVESVGLKTETYASARAFLDIYRPDRPGCVVLDVRMPGLSGLDLHERLANQGKGPPVIIITGHGDVPMAVHAMKAGAVDFIEKPFNDQTLLDSIHRALEKDARDRIERAQRARIGRRLAFLTSREREVMDMLLKGISRQEIAAELRVSCRTVDAHRMNIMQKMEADSLSELVSMVLMFRTTGQGNMIV